MFDDISYSKGASVLRMLRAYLTREMTPSPRLRRALQQVRGSLSAPDCIPCPGGQRHTVVQAAVLLSRDRQLATCCMCSQMIALPAWTILTGCRAPASGGVYGHDKMPCYVQDGSNILFGTEDDPFIRGVRIWLKAHQYSTSTTEQLWAAMSSAVGRNVGAWMQGWSYQEGFPLVRVTLGGITGREVSVSQVWASPLDHCWAGLAQLGALVAAAASPPAYLASFQPVSLSICSPIMAAQQGTMFCRRAAMVVRCTAAQQLHTTHGCGGALQKPFTMDGELGCGAAGEPGLAGERQVTPWWVPLAFKTSRDIATHWAPLETCASATPIYTLQVRLPSLTAPLTGVPCSCQ